MARNKHPEETEQRILDAAGRLFLEKGYDNTTIQDIVDALGNLTKGAVYHHFSCKEDIMDALGDRMFYQNNPFDVVLGRRDLNGLEKMRLVIRLSGQDARRNEMTRQAIPLLKNPRVLAQTMESNQKVLAPLWRKLLEEGNRDGSLHTDYPRELAELLPLLTSLWLLPSVFPSTKAQARRKFDFLAAMLDRMGVPLVDDATRRIIDAFFDRIPDGVYQDDPAGP